MEIESWDTSLPQQFVGLPQDLNAVQEENLLHHQREGHLLQSGESVFDVICGTRVNEKNVKALTSILQKFLENKEEYHLELSEDNLQKLHTFTQSVLQFSRGTEKTKAVAAQFLATLPGKYLARSFSQTEKHPLNIIFSKAGSEDVQKNVLLKVARAVAEKKQDARWQPLCAASDLIITELDPAHRRELLDIFIQEPDYEKAEVAIFKLLQNEVKACLCVDLGLFRARRWLPKIKSAFPHSPQFILYFKLVDEAAQLLESAPKNPDELKEFFEILKDGNWGVEAWKEAIELLGCVLSRQSRQVQEPVQDIASGLTARFRQLVPSARPSVTKRVTYEDVKFQVQIVDEVSRALVLANGSINLGLIDVVKRSIVEAKLAEKFPSLTARMLKILDELKNNPSLIDLFRKTQVPPPQSTGEEIVRASCQLAPDVPIGLYETNRTILSALFTDWRQYYFGSCHTTAPILALDLSMLRIRDWQEILQTGGLVRTSEGEKMTFPASPQLFPVLDDVFRLDIENASSLAHEPFFQRIKELFGYTDDEFIERIGQFLQEHRAETTLPVRKLVDALKPKDFDDAKGQFVLYQFNSQYQNPLMQCWQNCLMGMYYPPLASNMNPITDFEFAVESAFWTLVEEKHFESNPFFSQGHETRKYVVDQYLHCRVEPPQDPKQKEAQVSLYKKNPQDPWHPERIHNEKEFQACIGEMFFKITGRTLESRDFESFMNHFRQKARERIGVLKENSSPQSFLVAQALVQITETPWSFPFSITLEEEEEGLFEIYLQTDKKVLDLQLQGDLLGSIREFWAWVAAQKAHYGKIQGIKIPAKVHNHMLTVLPNEQMLEDPLPGVQEWKAELDKYVSLNDPLVAQATSALKRHVLRRFQRKEKSREQLEQALEALPQTTFTQWYQKFIEVLDSFDFFKKQDRAAFEREVFTDFFPKSLEWQAKLGMYVDQLSLEDSAIREVCLERESFYRLVVPNIEQSDKEFVANRPKSLSQWVAQYGKLLDSVGYFETKGKEGIEEQFFSRLQPRDENDWQWSVDRCIERVVWEDSKKPDIFRAWEETVGSMIPEDKRKSYVETIKNIPATTFQEWYKKVMALSDSREVFRACGRKKFERAVFLRLVSAKPEIAKKLVYQFADTNNDTFVGFIDKTRVPLNYGFALIPRVEGPPRWGIVEMKGEYVSDELDVRTLEYLKILKYPGKYFEAAANQNLVAGSRELSESVKELSKPVYDKLEEVADTSLSQEERERKAEECLAERKKVVEKMRVRLQNYDFDWNAQLSPKIFGLPDEHEFTQFSQCLSLTSEEPLKKLLESLLAKKKEQKPVAMEVEKPAATPARRKTQKRSLEKDAIPKQEVAQEKPLFQRQLRPRLK